MPKQRIEKLFYDLKGTKPDKTVALPGAGSYRQYFRLYLDNESYIAAYNDDIEENNAFISFSKHFFENGISVPRILSYNEAEKVYLLEDLGDILLLDVLKKHQSTEKYNEIALMHLKKVLNELIKLQIIGGKNLDYSNAYPVKEFDNKAILWDLNYFKYYFLKLFKVSFNEKRLENDFEKFVSHIAKIPNNYFMMRDCQSRNIMLKDNKYYFIDYQGGRKGPLQYDLSSLIYQAKAALSEEVKLELIDYYCKQASKLTKINKAEFINEFYIITLLRNLQTLGAYGFRGIIEGKAHFIESIPLAISNLEKIFTIVKPLIELPELYNCIEQINNLKSIWDTKKKDKLKVRVLSFSYKKGLPVDFSGNGGGHYFDCRAIHNPGRYEEYKELTGLDKPVIDFLNKENSMDKFIENTFAIAEQSVKKYIERGFSNLMVSFGCTGGRHRSVFAAEKFAHYIKEKYDIQVELEHREQNIKQLL